MCAYIYIYLVKVIIEDLLELKDNELFFQKFYKIVLKLTFSALMPVNAILGMATFFPKLFPHCL